MHPQRVSSTVKVGENPTPIIINMTRIANEVRRDVAKILGSSTGASDFPPLCVNTHKEKKMIQPLS